MKDWKAFYEPGSIASFEWLIVLCGVVTFLVFNLLTFNWYPTVWPDEVTFSEPAINLLKTGRFSTSVWQFEPANAFWAVNSPLYSLALSCWLRFTGTSLVAIRSFNYTLYASVILLVWIVSWKWNIVRTLPQRLLLIPLLGFGYGVSFAYRCSRPDTLGLVFLLLLAHAFRIRSPRVKQAALMLLSALTAWVGFQLALYACLACFVGWAILKRVQFKEMIFVGFGAVAGVFTVLLFFAYYQVLDYFVSSVLYIANKPAGGAQTLWLGISRRLMATASCYMEDLSLLPVWFGLGFALLATKTHPNGTRRLILSALALGLAVPLVFNFVGHFNFYYSGLLYIPVALALVAAYSAQENAPGRFRDRLVDAVFFASFLCAMLLGLPLRLGLTKTFCKIVPRSQIKEVLSSCMRPNDVVFCDFQAFFEAKQLTPHIYSPLYSREFIDMGAFGHKFTPSERKAITVAVVQPGQEKFLEQHFGGRWEAISDPFGDSFALGKATGVPSLGPRLAHHFTTPQTIRYPLQVYRRE